MIKLNVHLDIDAARRSLRGLEREVDNGGLRAMDRVITTVVKVAADEIGQRLNLRKRDIKAAISKRSPFGRRRFVRDAEAKGSPIPLRGYAARQTRRGVTYKIKQGSARRVYRAKGNAAFLLQRFGSHVFVRTEPDPPGPRKGRIRKVFGPSITQYFQTRIVRSRMLATATERWPIEFSREMRFRATRAQG